MSSLTALDALVGITRTAAQSIRVAQPGYIETKDLDDYVTDVDRHVQDDISNAIRAEFPGIPILGEEDLIDDSKISDDFFLIDPLDGTSNWIAGIAFCGVSVARIIDGKTVLAAVTDVSTRSSYGAFEGGGAYKNGRPMKIPRVPSKLFAMSTGLLGITHQTPGVFERLRPFGKLRNLGAQALHLCLVADGALAFSASTEARLWDDAAGRLIASEAGAIYYSGVETPRKMVPDEQQKSLLVHPNIASEVRAVLGPLLGLT